MHYKRINKKEILNLLLEKKGTIYNVLSEFIIFTTIYNKKISGVPCDIFNITSLENKASIKYC